MVDKYEVSSPRITTILADCIEWADNQPDPLTQAAAVSWLQGELQGKVAELAARRTTLLRDLHERGWSMGDIGEAIGLSKARVSQIIDPRQKDRKPAYLGARCDWRKVDGDVCTRAGQFRTVEGQHVCGTHAGNAVDQGLVLTAMRTE
jgi:hypothetical protein